MEGRGRRRSGGNRDSPDRVAAGVGEPEGAVGSRRYPMGAGDAGGGGGGVGTAGTVVGEVVSRSGAAGRPASAAGTSPVWKKRGAGWVGGAARVVIRPIELVPRLVNQRAPSGPAAIATGPLMLGS